MKRVFLLFMLLGTSANAATMCAPDLSTCESCTDGTYDGYSWSANCCGVQVSGYGFFVEGGIKNFTYVSQSFSNFPNALESEWNLGSLYYDFPVCVMTYPIVSKYAYIASDGYTCGESTVRLCAELFNPKCALTKCNESASTICGGTDPL